MTKKPRWLPRRQRQTILTCYQFNRHTKQSGYLTIKPCAGKPHNKGIFVKIPVGKTTETFLEYPNFLVMRRYFGAFFFNLIGFLHKKYSPVTSCVTQSVTSCHRAVTLCHALCNAVLRYVTLLCNALCNAALHGVPIMSPDCPRFVPGTCFTMSPFYYR